MDLLFLCVDGLRAYVPHKLAGSHGTEEVIGSPVTGVRQL